LFMGCLCVEGRLTKRDLVSDTPRDLLAHFLVSAYGLQKAAYRIDSSLEPAYQTWGLTTKNTDQLLPSPVENLIKCSALNTSSSSCSIEIGVTYTVNTALSEPQEQQVCSTLTAFFANYSHTNGNYDCATTLSTTGKRQSSPVSYDSAVVYSETEADSYQDDTITNFVFDCWELHQACPGIATSLQTTFKDWNLTTYGADNMLDFWDRNWVCNGGYCYINLVLPFSVADPTVMSSTDNQQSLCDAISAYFSTAQVNGGWSCNVTPRPTTSNPNRFLAISTYSEGSHGLSGGQKAGIIIGCLIIFFLLVAIIAVFCVQSQSKSRADYV